MKEKLGKVRRETKEEVHIKDRVDNVVNHRKAGKEPYCLRTKLRYTNDRAYSIYLARGRKGESVAPGHLERP